MAQSNVDEFNQEQQGIKSRKKQITLFEDLM
jgi:hypothetical protein